MACRKKRTKITGGEKLYRSGTVSISSIPRRGIASKIIGIIILLVPVIGLLTGLVEDFSRPISSALYIFAITTLLHTITRKRSVLLTRDETDGRAVITLRLLSSNYFRQKCLEEMRLTNKSVVKLSRKAENFGELAFVRHIMAFKDERGTVSGALETIKFHTLPDAEKARAKVLKFLASTNEQSLHLRGHSWEVRTVLVGILGFAFLLYGLLIENSNITPFEKDDKAESLAESSAEY